MGEYLNMNASATNMGGSATQARTNAMLARRQAYADAYKLEADADAASHVAGDNMMTMRQNQSANRAAARVVSAISGFAGGSAHARELSMAEYFEKVVGDAAKSNAISYQNASEQAGVLRRQGETQYTLGNIQANAYDRMAAINRHAAPWLGVGGLMSQTSNIMATYNVQMPWEKGENK